MYAKGEPFDLVALANNLDGIVTPLEIMEIISTGETKEVLMDAETVAYRIKHLKELYFFRVSMNTSTRIAEYAMLKDIEKVIKASAGLDRVRRVLFAREASDHFGVAVETINSPDEYIPASTPLTRAMIGGYSRKALSTIGGKSGHNKTTFTLFDLTSQLKAGIINKALYITVDEPGEMIARRVIANDMDISLKAMRDKKIKLSSDDVSKAISAFYKGKLIILDTARTPETIQQAVLDYAPDRTVLDHIQDVNFKDNDGISESGITWTLKLMKEAALKTSSNVTVLSQVKDKVIDERFEDKVPRPHDFFYASTMRQKCREQCVVYWRYKDSQDPIELPFFDFIVWKSTYSETGKIVFFIDPDKARFKEKARAIPQTRTESPFTNL